MGWLGLGVAVLALMRRRSHSLLAGVLALGIMLPSVGLAQSSDRPTPPWLRRDLTPAWANFEIRYGFINLQDDSISTVYRDNPTNILFAEVGPQFFRVAEIDFGFGFFQELAYTVATDGTQSGDRTMLTWFPFAIDITARAHILDEQP